MILGIMKFTLAATTLLCGANAVVSIDRYAFVGTQIRIAQKFDCSLLNAEFYLKTSNWFQKEETQTADVVASHGDCYVSAPETAGKYMFSVSVNSPNEEGELEFSKETVAKEVIVYEGKMSRN